MSSPEEQFESLADVIRSLFSRGLFRNVPPQELARLQKLGVVPDPDPFVNEDYGRYAGIISFCNEPQREQEFYKGARKHLLQLAAECVELRKLANAAIKTRAQVLSGERFIVAVDNYQSWANNREKILEDV